MPTKPDPVRLQPAAISYEVQVLTAGRWFSECVVPDRAEAEYEANRILESSRRVAGICVVREEIIEKTGLIVSTTLFRRLRDGGASRAEREDKRLRAQAKIAEIKADRRARDRALPVLVSAPAAISGNRAPRGTTALRRTTIAYGTGLAIVLIIMVLSVLK